MRNMIELRWNKVDPNKRHPEYAVKNLSNEWVILQYKTLDDYGGHNDDPDWSEWKDVPLEETTNE